MVDHWDNKEEIETNLVCAMQPRFEEDQSKIKTIQKTCIRQCGAAKFQIECNICILVNFVNLGYITKSVAILELCETLAKLEILSEFQC